MLGMLTLIGAQKDKEDRCLRCRCRSGLCKWRHRQQGWYVQPFVHCQGARSFVAAPITTVDTTLASGDAIPIEEPKAEELIECSKAPVGIKVWNPAFDVTPGTNISGIVTEEGVIKPDDNGRFDVKSFASVLASFTFVSLCRFV